MTIKELLDAANKEFLTLSPVDADTTCHLVIAEVVNIYNSC